ncbi:MAG: photosynthetic complex putative assembly protein PuhB [Geminicoccaceae bacterium]
MSERAVRRRPAAVLEHGVEPIPGLPEPLPPGERILWQGAPAFAALARRAFHLRAVAVYFLLLALWKLVVGLHDGAGWAAAGLDALGLVVPASLALGVLALLAWAYARSTIFTITDRRVVIRFGVALPMAVNLPFRQIEAAAVAIFRDGTADLPLALAGPDRVAWLHLWPFVRPWRLRRPEPMLRAVPNGAEVARILRTALERAAEARADRATSDDRAAATAPAAPLAAAA